MRHLEMEARLRCQDHQHEAETLKWLHQAPRVPVVHQLAESLRHLADRLDHLLPAVAEDTPHHRA